MKPTWLGSFGSLVLQKINYISSFYTAKMFVRMLSYELELQTKHEPMIFTCVICMIPLKDAAYFLLLGVEITLPFESLTVDKKRYGMFRIPDHTLIQLWVG